MEAITVLPQLSVHDKNALLKEELWKRGFYVQTIGQENKADYLVVSCAEPENTVPIEQGKPS